MNVILLEKVQNLGNLGDSVTVKAGYGRNYLIPYGKAVAANEENLAKFEARRAELEKKADETLQKAQQRADKLNALAITISAMASDEGKLYGSVASIDIARAVTEAGESVEKSEILMPEGPIHELGEFPIKIQLHSDVVATVTVTVILAK